MVRINGNCLHLRDLGVDAESSRCHGEEKPGSVCLACRWSSHVSSSFFTLLQCLVFEDIHPFLLLGCGAYCHFASRILWTKKAQKFHWIVLSLCSCYYCSSGLLSLGGEGYRDQDGGCGIQEQGRTIGRQRGGGRQLPSSISCHIPTYSRTIVAAKCFPRG